MSCSFVVRGLWSVVRGTPVRKQPSPSRDFGLWGRRSWNTFNVIRGNGGQNPRLTFETRFLIVQMPATPKKFVQSWLINTLAVLVAVYIVKGIHCQGALDVVVTSLVLGILNAVLRPLLLRLTLPLLFLTLGFFMLIINACILYLVGFLLKPRFYVDDSWSAFWGALIISVVGLILNSLTGTGNARIRIERYRNPRDRDGGSGPVIDV